MPDLGETSYCCAGYSIIGAIFTVSTVEIQRVVRLLWKQWLWFLKFAAIVQKGHCLSCLEV